MNATALTAALCCALAACAASAPPSPFFGDERYLQLGVDPRAEADAVVKAHERSGRPLLSRVEGSHFTALGFGDASGSPESVRVITARGIALALAPDLDATLPSHSRYSLWSPRRAERDANGDGFEDVFVLRSHGDERCLLAYRVGDVGFVEPQPLPAGLFDHPACGAERADSPARRPAAKTASPP